MQGNRSLVKASQKAVSVYLPLSRLETKAGGNQPGNGSALRPGTDVENPVRVWRQHREMSQVQLAEAAGISQAYLAQIKTGKREGTLSLYRSLADALEVDLDDLVG